MPLSKTNPLLDILQSSLVKLPTPSSITSFWNFGSILGLCLVVQIMSGLFLAMHYTSGVSSAFESVVYLSSDVNYGWLLRMVHANAASMFFFAGYLHIGRGLYYGSPGNSLTWLSGSVIFVLLMAIAFLGYVLPWGQMSFWGATVITNLISAVPYFGQTIVYWLWGGFSVGGSTLTRFFTFHFLMPFGLLALVVGHLVSLHEKGSSNPLGLNPNLDKIPFHPYFSFKDMVGFIVALMGLLIVVLVTPWLLGDSENFLSADPLVTPVHIKPEWYFLFAYAILRSIPNKLGGVLALGLSVGVLFVLPLLISSFKYISPSRKVVFWGLVMTFVLLTWIGGEAVETPYMEIGQLMSAAYFITILSQSSM